MPQVETSRDFKAFERIFAQIWKKKKEDRVQGVGLLTPKLIKDHIKSGQQLILQYGRQGGIVVYSPEELRQFYNEIIKTKGEFGVKKGAPVLQLLAASRKEDIDRVNKGEIKTAVLYKVRGDYLYFRASASPQSNATHHQVHVRLEDWSDLMTNATESFISLAKKAVSGRVSFDCDCGRHQYWYRYLATIGGFALSPTEQDFPKIRNKELTGCCCKHVIKTLKTMQTPVVYNLLALEMKKQADARGFADDEKKKRFLNKEEIARVKRATKQTSDIDHEAVQREWRDLQRAQEAFSRKQAEMAQKKKNKEAKAMAKEAQQESLAKRDAKIRKQYEAKAKSDEEEKKQLKADMEKLRQENEQTKRDTIVSNLFTALDVGKAFGVPREAVINKFSKDNKMTLDEVRALVERYKF